MSEMVVEVPRETEQDRICAEMRKIGLGSRYINRRFGDLDASAGISELERWAKSDAYVHDVLSGAGASVYGDSRAHEALMVLARATHLAGVRSRVIGLSVLVHEVSGETMSRALLDARAIFLHPFYKSEYKDPLTDYQRMAIDQFFMERLDDGRSIFTVASKPLRECRWWSSDLLRRLAATNIEIEA